MRTGAAAAEGKTEKLESIPVVTKDEPGAKKFEPIKMVFPDTVRTGAAATEYKAEKLKPLPARAKIDDPNIIMTGKSCARGLGSLYEV